MRKWLILLLALAILYMLPKINTRRTRSRYPYLKRLNETINILAFVLLVVYLAAFVYWLLTR
jgi:MFS superfamily sulfate permease-like transporter